MLNANNQSTPATASKVEWTFHFISTEQEYQQVLELRRLASGGQDLLALSCFADALDKGARIFVGKHKGKIIASLRMMEHISEQMEIARLVGTDSRLPNKIDTLEITGVCLHPEYQRADVLIVLFRRAIVLAKSERRYLLGYAPTKLLADYRRLGFHFTGITFADPVSEGETNHVFMSNLIRESGAQSLMPMVSRSGALTLSRPVASQVVSRIRSFFFGWFWSLVRFKN